MLVFVLPFSIWAICMVFIGEKLLGNLAECLVIALAIPFAFLIRVLLGHQDHEARYSFGLLLALCGVAVAAYVLIPPLPVW